MALHKKASVGAMGQAVTVSRRAAATPASTPVVHVVVLAPNVVVAVAV